MLKINPKKKEIYFWLLLILIVFFLSLPSLIMIYKIRYLYLSSAIRQETLQAVIYLREQRGYGATDLTLNKIVKEDNGNKFYFTYCYHSPRIDSIRKKILVVFKKGDTREIKDI